MQDEEPRGDCQEEQTEGQVEVREDGRKTLKRTWPNYLQVRIEESDSHYLVSFHHKRPRVFHNVEELLVAIEVEVKRLGGTLGGG